MCHRARWPGGKPSFCAQAAPPSLDCVRFLNFPDEALALLWRAPLSALEAAAAGAVVYFGGRVTRRG
jgi:hypothetical protein